MAHPVMQILNVGDIAELARAERSDAQLLDLFVRQRDEEAFAAVVRRHGPMVLAVCRRVLRNPADADDAFQAAFLVLARKAASLSSRGRLASWLHGVAFNTARRLQRANTRRAGRERSLDNLPEPAAVDDVSLREELVAWLDAELSQLPERYRLTLVLCDLEGFTRKEVARQLGCPEGTVAGRLARARALLAARLANRGIAPSAGLLAVLLTQRLTGALNPAHLTGVIGAVFGGAVSRRVSITVERVVAAMFIRKLKPMGFALLVGGILAAATGLFRADASSGADPAAPPDAKSAKGKPVEPKPSEARVLTELPLKKLDPNKTAEKLRTLYPGKAIITPVVSDKVLLLYADAKTTHDIEDALVAFGEAPRKKLSRIPLRFTVADDITRSLTEIFVGPPGGKPGPARLTIVPVADENALLVYATDADTLSIRKLLADHIDAAPAPGKPVPPKPAALASKTYTVRFENALWKDVLEWYGQVSGLQMVGENIPAGALTLKPPKDREFTVAEITDLLNEWLMPRNYILIRRQTTFRLHPADEKIDPSWVSRVELEDLMSRGTTELVQVLIPFDNLDASDIAAEIRKLLSPFGSLVVLTRANALLVLDTVGNVRRITATLQMIAKPKRTGEPPIRPADPELRKYSVPAGTADATAKKLLAENPALRIIAVQAANEIWVMATPEEHVALAKKLGVPKADKPILTTVTIPLTHSDPAEIIPLLQKVFPRASGWPEIKNATSGKRAILIKGTPEQIKDIRAVIELIDKEDVRFPYRP